MRKCVNACQQLYDDGYQQVWQAGTKARLVRPETDIVLNRCLQNRNCQGVDWVGCGWSGIKYPDLYCKLLKICNVTKFNKFGTMGRIQLKNISGHGCRINFDSQLTQCLFIIHLPSLNELQRNAYSQNMLGGEDLIFVNNRVIDRKEFQNK